MQAKQVKVEKLGKYYLEKRIGVGGMAEIYLASLQSDPKSRFAIKKILSAYAKSEHLVSMLINEAQVTVSLRHPNIVSIYDFGRVEDSYYLAMEYVEGEDLTSLISAARRAGQTFPIDVALYIMMEVLEGLAYAHGKRDNFNRPLEIVHRDISPHNIMISKHGQVKILDFGIAKVRGKAAETQAGILKGKFSYMSPEQARGAKIDRRTDIFSSGITLYEVLTLENPFFYESELETLNHVKRASYKSPRLLNRAIPKNIERVIHKSLRRLRVRRYRWAEDMQRDIAAIQKEVGFAGPKELKEFMSGVVDGKADAAIPKQVETSHRQKSYKFEAPEQSSDVYYIDILKRRRLLLRAAGSLAGLLVIGFLYFYIDGSGGWDKLKSIFSREDIVKTVADNKSNSTSKEGKTQALAPAIVINADLNVIFTGKADTYLNNLPFEKYETVRDDLSDGLVTYLKSQAPEKLRIEKVTPALLDGYKVSYRLVQDSNSVEVVSIARR